MTEKEKFAILGKIWYNRGVRERKTKGSLSKITIGDHKMEKAYTITIVSETKEGKAVIMAKSYKDAMNQARQACPEGFRVFKVQENGREQRGYHRHSPVKCALGGVAENGRLYKPQRKPAFWTGKKTGDFKKC